MTNYIFQWLSNGWIGYNGQAVVNKVDFRELLGAMEDMDVKWVKISVGYHYNFHTMNPFSIVILIVHRFM